MSQVRANTSARAAMVVAAAGLLAATPAVDAALVTFVGSVINDAGGAVSQWKTPGVAKPFDGDADNIYGTLAHVFYNVSGKGFGPGGPFEFISSDRQFGPFGAFSSADDPNQEGQPSPTDISLATTTNDGAGTAGVNESMVLFAVGATGPANFRFGVAVDGLDSVDVSPVGVGLAQVGGPAGSSVVVPTVANNILDLFLFDVTGAVPGDQFDVLGTASAQGFVTNQLLTFDTVVPEPTTLGLLGAGGLLALGRRRRPRVSR